MGKYVEIPIKLKQLRKDKGITQRKLAEEIGVSLVTIKQYENGKRQPSLPIVSKLLQFYNLTFSDLPVESDNRHKRIKVK